MDVNYEFSIDDIIECMSNGVLYKLKKVDVLGVMSMQDNDDFRTFDGFRIVKDIIQIDYIIYTNRMDALFRVTYIITGGYFKESKVSRMFIDNLPNRIREMKLNRVLDSK